MDGRYWLVLLDSASTYVGGGHSLLSAAHSDTYIVLYKSRRGVKMPVRVHAAHVHFMLECPALAAEDECVCIDDVRMRV